MENRQLDDIQQNQFNIFMFSFKKKFNSFYCVAENAEK